MSTQQTLLHHFWDHIFQDLYHCLGQNICIQKLIAQQFIGCFVEDCPDQASIYNMASCVYCLSPEVLWKSRINQTWSLQCLLGFCSFSQLPHSAEELKLWLIPIMHKTDPFGFQTLFRGLAWSLQFTHHTWLVYFFSKDHECFTCFLFGS